MTQSSVDVTDLLRYIVSKQESNIVEWLCFVRDSDKSNSSISKAADAVLGTLIRLYCAKYLTRSVTHIEHFESLVSASYDMSIDSNKRWQRIANVVCYLMYNPRKEFTIHVYPCLSTPLLELDDGNYDNMQNIIPVKKIIKLYQQYIVKLECSDDALHADATRAWLSEESLSHGEHVKTLCMLEHFLSAGDAKNSHRICTYLITACPDLKSTNMHDVFECIWKVVIMTIDHVINPTNESDLARYLKSCRNLYFKSLPPKRKARQCRLALLYYAILVLCSKKIRPFFKETGITFGVINLPVTVDESMSYLTVFPRLP